MICLVVKRMKFPYKHAMSVAAHRGDWYNCFENTMDSFEAARIAGTDMIETDVRMTADGHLVLMHDEKVLRTTGEPGQIRDMTLAQVCQLNAGNDIHPAKVPTLEEFLCWAKPYELWLNLELKEYHVPGNEARCRECVDKVVTLIRKYGLTERVVLNSFDAWVLEYADEAYDHSFKLHGFYPYAGMMNVNRNPDEYLYCACIWGCGKKKEYYDHLLEAGIDPWVGSSFTSADSLEMACRYGAVLVTTNAPGDCIEKLKGIGKRE